MAKIHRHAVSEPMWLNCVIGILVLLITRKIKSVYYIKGGHFMGKTRKGNFLHFKTTSRHERFSPLFFEGFFEAVSGNAERSQWQDIFYYL